MTLLLIDSHKEDREYWTERLKISSPQSVVLEAKTGKEGLAICRLQRVDCVVTELTLSDVSGFEVLVNLVPRAKSPEMAVVILTHQLLVPIATLAPSNGAQADLVKSRSSGDDLDKAIQKAIAAVGPYKKREP